MKKLSLFTFSFLLFAFTSSFGQGNSPDAAYVKDNYIKHEYQVPMRDGKKLFTSVYVPKDSTKKYPFMMDRTCYSVAPYGPDKYKGSLGPSSLFLHDGYIFVYQDVRGRWMSEGIYEEMTPEKEVHKTNKDVDEGTDTYDTIDWLLKNIPNNNGKVGVWGISYPGFYTTAALLSRHPALVAASPQAPIADLYRDDAFHNGAFMLVANFDFYPSFTNRQDDKPTQRRGNPVNYEINDGYKFFLDMGNMKNSNDMYYKDTIRLWNEMLDHPNYDQHWKDRNVLYHLHDIKTAVLVTGGWYDAEDLYGAINTYKTLVKDNPTTPIYFAMGPWVHGGWSWGPGDHLGDIDFGGQNGPYYREKIELAFFNHYLKGTDTDIPKVSTFETGVNKWKNYTVWPPKEAVEQNLYLLPGGKLSFDAPAASADSQVPTGPRASRRRPNGTRSARICRADRARPTRSWRRRTIRKPGAPRPASAPRAFPRRWSPHQCRPAAARRTWRPTKRNRATRPRPSWAVQTLAATRMKSAAARRNSRSRR